jgi:hypothetical protein
MPAVVAIDVADEFEIADPFINAKQVEIGSTYEIDGGFVAMEKAACCGVSSTTPFETSPDEFLKRAGERHSNRHSLS